MIKNYKINYLIPLSGGSKMNEENYILLDGNSSTGKSTICNFFKTKDYTCLKGDDLLSNDEYWTFYGNEYKKIPNAFVTAEFKKNMKTNIAGDYFYEKAVEKSKTVIDWVVPNGIINSFQKNNKSLFIILVYAGLSTLTRNIMSRKAENDPRGTFVFKQFSNRFIKTTIKSKIIDTVNRKKFKKILLDNFKMEFTGKTDLENFCIEIFKNMEIEDDLDHNITIRDDYKYNYLLNTNGKTKEDIIDELNILIN